MEKISTAEDLLLEVLITNNNSFDISNELITTDVLIAMKSFAKLHVTEALKQASDKLRQASGTFNADYNGQKIAIFNAYSLENIK